jgi:ribosomal protein S18 acetylase RimI-like enzyme
MTVIALDGAILRPLEPADAPVLAQTLTAMAPWARLGYGAAALEGYLKRQDPALTRWVIERNGTAAGLLALRFPWLRGPYIELLAILPHFQGNGLGGTVMDWAARHAAEIAPNLWACVSDFNAPARAFYARHGFEEVTELDGLVTAGMSEILLRRRLQQ